MRARERNRQRVASGGDTPERGQHKAIRDWRKLRQAPTLGGGVGIKQVMLEWCQSRAADRRSHAWRILGRAVLFHSAGAHMVAWVHASLGCTASSRVNDWLRWHRRRKAFSLRDLRVDRKISKARGLWIVLTRGRVQQGAPAQVQAPRPVVVSSRAAACALLSLRSGGFARCEVGRLPLHIQGDLPAVGKVWGRVPDSMWVTPRQGAASEAELIHILKDGAGSHHREAAKDSAEWSWVAEALRNAGGGKIISLHRLQALRVSRNQKLDLQRVRANTLTTSRGLKMVLLLSNGPQSAQAQILDAQDWASLMGIPLQKDHPIRVGLRAVPESTARSIVGQAVHFNVAVALLDEVLDRLDCKKGATPVVYVSLLSGIDFAAAALFHIVGDRMQFALAAEANAAVAKTLRAAWGSRLGTLTGYALSAETELCLKALQGTVNIMMISLRCAPWSQANALPVASHARRSQVARALEENQALLRLAAGARPQALVLECVDGGVRRDLKKQWLTLHGIICHLREWEWTHQRVCPRDTLQGYIPRMRVWFVGIRRGAR